MGIFKRAAQQPEPVVSTTLTTPEPPQALPCAWCNDEKGLPQGNGSHGICERHGQALQAQFDACRGERKARRK